MTDEKKTNETTEEHYHVSGTWNFCPGCGRVVVKR